MRILHVTECYLPLMGGIENQVSQLAAHQSRDHQVAVFTTTPARPGTHGRSRERHDAVDVFRASAPFPAGAPVNLRARRHLNELVRRWRPDVVHFHMGGTAPSVQLALAAAAGLPRVLTVHSVWTPRAVLGYRLLASITGFPAQPLQLSAVSRLTAHRVESALRQPVRVVGNGSDVEAWRVAPVPHAGVHVVSATRFAPRKRVFPLLRMLLAAHRELGPHSGLRATIAGSGPELARSRAWVADHGMADWVTLPGRLSADELRAVYAAADIYLAPVILEAFSIAILEAQSAGLAIVCRSQSGAAERLTDGVDGLVARDDAGLVAGLVRLVRDRPLLESIKAHNRATRPPYDWETVLREMESVYRAAAQLLRTSGVTPTRSSREAWT